MFLVIGGQIEVPTSKSMLEIPSKERTPRSLIPLGSRTKEAAEPSVLVDGQLDYRSLFHRYERTVRAILVRLLGIVPGLDDLSQEVFIQVIRSVHRLRDETKVGPFVSAIAVNVARAKIRKEQRFRWLKRQLEQEPTDLSYEDVDPSFREALRAALAIVRQFPVDERVAFSLHYFENIDVLDVAESCQVSRSTIKRRLIAEQRFQTMASEFPALQSWLTENLS